jgi:hypothetical protein
MTEFFARGKMITDEPDDAIEKRRELGHREFAKRALATLTGIVHHHNELMDRVAVLQEEIRKRILAVEAPPKPPAPPDAKRILRSHKKKEKAG